MGVQRGRPPGPALAASDMSAPTMHTHTPHSKHMGTYLTCKCVLLEKRPWAFILIEEKKNICDAHIYSSLGHIHTQIIKKYHVWWVVFKASGLYLLSHMIFNGKFS